MMSAPVSWAVAGVTPIASNGLGASMRGGAATRGRKATVIRCRAIAAEAKSRDPTMSDDEIALKLMRLYKELCRAGDPHMRPATCRPRIGVRRRVTTNGAGATGRSKALLA
jgi:hypothetical protein